MSVNNSIITRNYMEFNIERGINFNAGGGGINYGNPGRVTRMNLNNISINGTISLDDVILTGNINTQLQSSLFNILSQNIVDSKSSKVQGDQYGAVYGPVYGDVLGTVNSRGAFIGTSSTGYIGDIYDNRVDTVSLNQLKMLSIVNPQITGTQASQNAALTSITSIPKNITTVRPNLVNFDVNVYNTTSVKNAPITNDTYFGNLYPVTYGGVDDNSYSGNVLSAILTKNIRQNTNFQIVKNGSDYTLTGNMNLPDYNQTYTLKNAIINNLSASGSVLYNLVNGNITSDNTNLTANSILTVGNTDSYGDIDTPNLIGNVTIEYTIDGTNYNYNGNVVYDVGEYYVDYVIPDVPETKDAEFLFPNADIGGTSRFNTVGANLLYINNGIMNGTESYYDGQDYYGNVTANVYNRFTTLVENTVDAEYNWISVDNTNKDTYIGNCFNLHPVGDFIPAVQTDLNNGYVYLSIGDTVSTSIERQALVIGPLSSEDYSKEYLINTYLDFNFRFLGTDGGATLRLMKFTSTIKYDTAADIISYVLPEYTYDITNNDSNTISSVFYNWDTTQQNIHNYNPPPSSYIYSSIDDVDYVYYVIFYFQYSGTPQPVLIENLQLVSQSVIPPTTTNINKNENNKTYTLNFPQSLLPAYSLVYNYNQDNSGAQLSISPNTLLNFTSEIVEDSKLIFNGNILADSSNNLSGNMVMTGNQTFSSFSITGTLSNGSMPAGNLDGNCNIIVNSNINYYSNDYYTYNWHANCHLDDIESLQLSDGTVIDGPFDGTQDNLMLIVGQLAEYNSSTKTFSKTPLFDNQLAIMDWTFAPTNNFTISFKYQLFSEIRGDYFHFQYSNDNGRTYNDLLKQSGDIKSIKSKAIYTRSNWKTAEFYLPGGSDYNYKFRWAYNKDVSIDNSYDTAVLADIYVKYVDKVISTSNGDTYFVGNILSGNISSGSASSEYSGPPYSLKLFKNEGSANTGFFDGNSLVFGTNYMSSSTKLDGTNYQNAPTLYANLTTSTRINNVGSEYPYITGASDLTFRNILGNSSTGQRDLAWRVYSKSSLRNEVSSALYDLTLFNGSVDWNNDNEFALMSSLSKSQNSLNGLQNGDATYLSIGPIDRSITELDKLQYSHIVSFKYIAETELGYDLTGIAYYDYSGGDDTQIRTTLYKLLTFDSSFHVDSFDLNTYYNTGDIIDTTNIKYIPATDFTYEGIYNYDTTFSGWRNVNINVPGIGSGNKRIYVIYFNKDSSVSESDDVILLHDLQFKFTQSSSTSATPNQKVFDKYGFQYAQNYNPQGTDEIPAIKISKIVESSTGITNDLTITYETVNGNTYTVTGSSI